MDKVGSPRVRPPGSACWLLRAHREPSENGWCSRAASHAQTGERLGVLGPGIAPSWCQTALRIKLQPQARSERNSKCNSHSQLPSGSGGGWDCPEITPWPSCWPCLALHPRPLPRWSSWGHVCSRSLSSSSSALACFWGEPSLGH